MNLKTFSAGSMPEALAQVRNQFGSHGVVLHTRSYKRGGILGLGAKTVVEVTAADGREIGRQRRTEARQSPRAQVAEALKRRVAAATPRAEPAETPLAGDLIKRTYAAARAELEKQQPKPAAPPAAPAEAVTVSPVGVQQSEQLAREMQAIRQMVTELMQKQQAAPRPVVAPRNKPKLPPSLMDQYLALMGQEVSEELAREVVDKVKARLSAEQLDDAEACRQAVQDEVAALLPTAMSSEQPDLPPTEDGRPRTIALVGPTGVGKTTTVAKLAATFKLRQRKRVGMVTLDTYRIAAVDQLRTYASIIGVTLHVARSGEELTAALAACADCDVVLIDTAGRAPRDDQRLGELQRFLEIARPHETHLVLSSTCTQSALLDAAERFSKVRTDRIIFTKMDEAVTFGVVLNVARRVNKQLSFVTTGQEVPHHIEVGRATRIAALVTGDKLQTT